MDPLLYGSYLASAALGPLAIAGWTGCCVLAASDENATYTPGNTLTMGILAGLASLPLSRRYSNVSRDLEKCVKKEPKVKYLPDGRLRVISDFDARKEALDAAVPVWFYYGFPSLIYAIATPNDKDRVVASMLGITCAGLAAACRLQSSWSTDALEKQKEIYPGGKVGKPMLYFNKANSDAATSLDEYSAEVKRILENKKIQKNTPGTGGGGSGLFSFWPKFGSGTQRKQPDQTNVRILLAGMK